MGSAFLDALHRRVLVLDGAMGTSIHKIDLDLEKDYLGCENCPEILVDTRPDVLRQVHGEFLEAGADGVETDSFGGARHVLREFGLEDRCRELNRKAAEVAREACEQYATAERPRFVMGSMGPGTKLITLGQIGWDELLASYTEQARGLIEGGVDAFVIETCQDLLQVKCATNAILDALKEAGKGPEDIPIIVSLTIETTGTMLVGASVEAAVTALKGYPIACLGLNCATGPTEMARHIQTLRERWPGMISVVPNAGLPVLVEGRTEYPLRPRPFADALVKFIEGGGVHLVGGCCGTTPEHIKALAEAVDGREPVALEREETPPACGSLYESVEYRQDNSILIVGERMNASGSRKFKRLLEGEDFEDIAGLAKQQVRDGSHVLDLNVDYAGRDNAADMSEIVRRVVRQVNAPLMLDSTQVATLEAGLKHAPGKCIINSANFEDGEEKFDQICQLARRFNAALVIGSIDEDKESAMARTAERKVAIAKRAMERATKVHGLDIGDILFDPLVLPISTGMDSDRRSGLETIEGVRRIKAELPECQTVVGLSNVSFGLSPAARQVLNSVFMHELEQAGLTSAIVHASKILPLAKIDPEHREAALHLIYDRRAESARGTGLPEGVADEGFDPLGHFIDLFKDVKEAAESGPAMADLPLEERLRKHIIDGERDGLTEMLDEAMEKYSPLEIINDHLLDGMKVVGELFGAGEMQLPFVLQSAEVMKRAVAHLEPHMEKVKGQTKGTIVLATVKGDVHDIGKNLVDIILSNNGYTVHNIGIKQPIENIIAKWEETRADAIGLSGLLVKSVMVMEDNLRELNERGLAPTLMLGGAALSRHYAEGHLRGAYQGQCFYGKDAFEGLRLMDCIMGGRIDEVVQEIEERIEKRSEAEQTIARSKAAQAERVAQFEASLESGGGEEEGGVAVLERSEVATDVEVPRAPFFGSRVVESVPLEQIYPYINEVALFRGQWQFKRGAKSKAEYERFLEDEVYPVFERLKAQCIEEEILRPQVVYGYFPCASDGDALVVFDPDDAEREVERFRFPRQQGKRRLCISDFFRPVESGERDVIGMSCVTMGPKASERTRDLFEAGDYSEYLFLHGMSVESAEALAEMWHKRMRQELAIDGEDAPDVRALFQQKYRGSRYSFGYPACPNMADQEILWRLLEPQRIGCDLTENWQIDPEQSTSAIIVHHPEAKYFNV